MDSGTLLTAIIGGITTVVAGIGTGIGTWARMRHVQRMEVRKQDAEDDATAIGQYAELANRLEKQNARWEADSVSKQKLIDGLAEKDTLCQIRLARYWGWMAQATDRINLLTGMLREAGKEPHMEPLLVLKPPPEFDDRAGFDARTSAQNTAAISGINPIPPPMQRPPGV